MTSTTKADDLASPQSDYAKDLHCYTETNGVITTTMFDVPGYRIKRVLGVVYGMSVRSRNIGASIAMGLKSMAGGELKMFTTLVYNARNDAISRLVKEAQSRGGNAVIAMHFDTSDLGTGFTQVCAYGTAAEIEKADANAPQYVQLGKAA